MKRGPQRVLPAARILHHATYDEVLWHISKMAAARVKAGGRITIDAADRWCTKLGLPLMTVWPEAYGDDLIPVAMPPMTEKEIVAADREWCHKSWRKRYAA